MQVTVNLDKELVHLIDEVAEKLYISRSAYISVTMSRAVKTEQIKNKKTDKKADESLPTNK